MFDIYIKKAIKNQSLTQNELAKKIGISNACMSKMKTAKILPSEETLLKVAALAGIPAEKALIDLNLWRSKNYPDRYAAWIKLSKLILPCIIAFLPTIFIENELKMDDFYQNYTLCDKMILLTIYLYFCYKPLFYLKGKQKCVM